MLRATDSHLRVSSVFLIFIVYMGSKVLGDQFEYLGCFDTEYAIDPLEESDLLLCAHNCSQRGNTQVGIEQSELCYCADDLVRLTKIPDALCDLRCGANFTNFTCGGQESMSVYKMVKRQSSPPDINKKVKLLLALDDGAKLYRLSKIPEYDRAINALKIHSVDYHFSKGFVFGHINRSQIVRSSLDGKDSPYTVIKNTSGNSEGLAVDWIEDKIYYADGSPSEGVQILSMDLDGKPSDQRTLNIPKGLATITRLVVDPFKKILVWVEKGRVRSCDFSGIHCKSNMSTPGVSVRGLSLDLDSQRIFYIGTSTLDSDSPALYSMNYQGGDGHLHYRTLHQMDGVFGMGVFGDFVYWVVFSNGEELIYKGPKVSTEKHVNAHLLTEIEKVAAHDLKVVHPDLQKAAKSKVACSPGFVLQDDQETCTDGNEKQSSKTYLMLVGVFVSVVVLALLAAWAYRGDVRCATLRERIMCTPSRKTARMMPPYSNVGTDENLLDTN